jgi:hypothetical protein
MKKQKVIDSITISLEDVLVQGPHDAETLLRKLLFNHLTENQALNAVEYLKSISIPNFNEDVEIKDFETIEDTELFDEDKFYF